MAIGCAVAAFGRIRVLAFLECVHTSARSPPFRGAGTRLHAAGTRFHRKSDSSLGASESNLARGLARDRGRASGQGRNERTVALRGCPCTRGGRHAHAPIAAGPFTQPAQASHATEAGGGRMSSLCPVCRARTNSKEKNYRKYIEAGGGRVSSQRRARTKNSQRENITILNFEFGIAGSGQK